MGYYKVIDEPGKNQMIQKPLIEELKKYLLKVLGLNFTDKSNNDLVRKMNHAAKGFHYSDISRFVNWLLKTGLTDKQLQLLSCYLTIGETYFFREKKSFDFIQQIYLPGLIAKRYKKDQKIRIWSAGCATGEEPYSVAILLLKVIPDIKNWDISIIATDINPDFLEKAKKGIYTKWSFRNNQEHNLDRYFRKDGKNLFHILPEIKKMVTFSSVNLVDETYPGITNNTNAMDIIFCRNVLIYFSKEGIRNVTRRFYESLAKGGILIVSPVEMSNLISGEFSKIYYSGYTFYQKENSSDRHGVLIPEENLRKSNEKQKLQSEIKFSHRVYDVPSEIPEPGIKQEKPLINNKTEENDEKQDLYETALSKYKHGLLEDAEYILTPVINGNHKNKEKIILLLTKVKADRGKLEEAGLLCNQLLETDKLNKEIYYLLATILYEQGKYPETVPILKRAIYLDQDFVLAHFLLGNVYLKTGKNNEGQKHLKNAVNIISNLDINEIIPESEGLTAGRLTEILTSIKI